MPVPEAQSVLDEIHATGKRRIRTNYLRRRFEVEGWLIGERRKKLGSTSLERPIHFILGDFADGRDPSRPQSFLIPETVFSPDMITFTYRDSIATRDDHLHYRKEYHGQVFTLGEIKEVVARLGMPGDRCKEDPSMRYDRIIEVQVWDDGPIKRRLRGQKHGFAVDDFRSGLLFAIIA